jgi:hypothetical protein
MPMCLVGAWSTTANFPFCKLSWWGKDRPHDSTLIEELNRSPSTKAAPEHEDVVSCGSCWSLHEGSSHP